MDKQLLADLKEIEKAIERKDKILNGLKYDNSIYCDVEVEKRYKELNVDIPQPVEPKKPELRQDRVIEPEKRKAHIYSADDFLPTKVTIIVSIVLIIVGFITFIVGNIMASDAAYSKQFAMSSYELAEYEAKETAGNVIKIVSYCLMGGAGVLLYPTVLLIKLFSNLASSAKYEKKCYENAVVEKERTIENNKRYQEAYEQEVKKYPELLEEYNKQMDEYNKKVKEKEAAIKAYNDDIAKANKELEAYNKTIREKAERELDEVLNNLKTYFPKKYINVISRIRGYIEDARADNLTDAINLYEKENQEELRRLDEEIARNAKRQYRVHYSRWDRWSQRMDDGYTFVQAKDAADACAQVEGATHAEEW